MYRNDRKVSVIDYGAGNIQSMLNSLEYIGVETEVISSPKDLRDYTHIIIPGVGSFDDAMQNLIESDLIDSLNEAQKSGVLILGVCLGMQILCKGSDEGTMAGLSWFDLYVNDLSEYSPVKKTPHMGWNDLRNVSDHPLLRGIPEVSDVYFVHSFGVTEDYREYSLAEANCGINFSCIIGNKNVFGMQFHPEKSQNIGLKLLTNFLELKEAI